MNLAHVDQEKNIKNAVVLYKKNIKQANKTIIPKEIPKFIFDLKKFSTILLILFFLTLSELNSSNGLTNPLDLPIIKNLFFL